MIDTNSPQYIKGKLGEDFVAEFLEGFSKAERHPFAYRSGASTWDFLVREFALIEVKTFKLCNDQITGTSFFFMERDDIKRYHKDFKEKEKAGLAKKAQVWFVCAERKTVYGVDVETLSKKHLLQDGYQFKTVKNAEEKILWQIPLGNLLTVTSIPEELCEKILALDIPAEKYIEGDDADNNLEEPADQSCLPFDMNESIDDDDLPFDMNESIDDDEVDDVTEEQVESTPNTDDINNTRELLDFKTSVSGEESSKSFIGIKSTKALKTFAFKGGFEEVDITIYQTPEKLNLVSCGDISLATTSIRTCCPASNGSVYSRVVLEYNSVNLYVGSFMNYKNKSMGMAVFFEVQEVPIIVDAIIKYYESRVKISVSQDRIYQATLRFKEWFEKNILLKYANNPSATIPAETVTQAARTEEVKSIVTPIEQKPTHTLIENIMDRTKQFKSYGLNGQSLVTAIKFVADENKIDPTPILEFADFIKQEIGNTEKEDNFVAQYR